MFNRIRIPPQEVRRVKLVLRPVCGYCFTYGWRTRNPSDPPAEWVRECKGCRSVVENPELDIPRG